MDVRHQIFVSSTYEDLQEERAEVMQALLELDCMPAGMELFPAASEEQWQWITRVIDESDYYLVVIGSKYGSINTTTHLSYTEMEYRYAVEIGKPCIAFILDKSVDPPLSRSEIDPDKKAKLDAFKALVQTKLCKYWNSTSDLGAKVSRSVTQLVKRVPAIGWVRADQAARSNNEEVLALKNQILELERTLEALRRTSQGDTHDLSRGDDQYNISFRLMGQIETAPAEGQTQISVGEVGQITVPTTWNEIATNIGPTILSGGNQFNICGAIIEANRQKVKNASRLIRLNTSHDWNIEISHASVYDIRIQFVALGFLTIEMEPSSNIPGYGWMTERWVPTSEGRAYFGRQSAIKRSSIGEQFSFQS